MTRRFFVWLWLIVAVLTAVWVYLAYEGTPGEIFRIYVAHAFLFTLVIGGAALAQGVRP